MTGLLQFSGTGHAGVRLNNLTTTERDALSASAGMLIYNATTGRPEWRNASAWVGSVLGAGAGAANRVALWSDANTVISSANFQFDATTVTWGFGAAPIVTSMIRAVRSGAKTDDDAVIDISESSTNSGANKTKYGIYVQSTGSWNGTVHGLYIASISGGTVENWAIYNATSENVYLGGGKVGCGTTVPGARIESLSTTEQLRLSYDATNFTSFTVGVSGGLTLTPKSGASLSISLAATGDLIVNTSQFVVDTSAARIGLNTTTPSYSLSFGGDTLRQIGLERFSTGDNAGSDLLLRAGGATVGATNKAGGNLILISGLSTGTGSSRIEFWVSQGTGSGTSDNDPYR